MHDPTQAILILGATGNVGAPLVDMLNTQGYRVRAGVTPRSIERYCAPAGVEPVAFDFADPATYATALAGVQKLFLLRPPQVTDPEHGINPFIDAARAAGIRQIVFLSILGAEKNGFLPHRKIEQHLEAGPADWTFLRASFFMQNLSTTHRDEIRERGELLMPAGNGATSFIDTRDIAAVAAHCLTEEGHTGRAYDLTGNEALNYHTVAQALSAYLGKSVRYRKPSLLQFIRDRRSSGLDWGFVLVMSGIYTTVRLGLAAQVASDTERILGRAPITLGQFIIDERRCWA
ncbi:MAG: SDR family oxidoreductase [Oscillochloris sp.]|nr:SDR family oxidoreductase [Oscillochloris sp.]